MTASGPGPAAALAQRLREILGPEGVLDGSQDRRYFAYDIAGAGAVPALVVVPRTVDALAAAVGAITAAGHAVLPRGGGSSYSGGYLGDRETAAVIDTRRLDRVVDVDTRSMHVTVEAGCTWARLLDALEPHGVRTPFWGPLSGAVATIGGSLSQNAILWGSARHGTSAESVIGLDVVLADGTILTTGAGSGAGAVAGTQRLGIPFLRNYGPDLCGPFLGDCGALGVKARATLKLIRSPAAFATASFGFEARDAMVAAMTDVAREGLASECFGMDPTLQRQRLKRGRLAQGVKAVAGVIAAEGLVTGLKDAAKVAIAGRRFLDDVGYSMHVGADAREHAAAAAAIASIRHIARQHGGVEVPDSVPKLMRGARYVSMTSAIGPEGERWLPVHALLPLSDAAEAWHVVHAVLARHAAGFARHGIEVGVLTAVVGTTTFALEPVFYWPAPRTPYYERVLDPATLRSFTDFALNPEGEALVFEARRELIALFAARGAAHLQIGRTYGYRDALTPPAYALLCAIKHALDPRGLMNPGVLGLP
jgi:FAD/FMN-containing dehydrogenase